MVLELELPMRTLRIHFLNWQMRSMGIEAAASGEVAGMVGAGTVVAWAELQGTAEQTSARMAIAIIVGAGSQTLRRSNQGIIAVAVASRRRGC